MTKDLAARIELLLRNPNTDPWFPELTDELAIIEWHTLNKDIGLTPNTYGSSRVLYRSASAPRAIIATLTVSSLPKERTISIEAVNECAASYNNRGVSFYSKREIQNKAILCCLEDALSMISQVPSLMRTVLSLVQSVHLVRPPDPDYDVSFSEPNVPFSIFVSVPEKRIKNDALRVAESIVHEAMHLLLTLMERAVPLVASMSKQYYSPWKREFRNVQGILHAVYVFGVVYVFLQKIAPLSELNEKKHIYKRVIEIGKQLAYTQRLDYTAELTPNGCRFVQKLFSSIHNSNFRSELRYLASKPDKALRTPNSL